MRRKSLPKKQAVFARPIEVTCYLQVSSGNKLWPFPDFLRRESHGCHTGFVTCTVLRNPHAFFHVTIYFSLLRMWGERERERDKGRWFYNNTQGSPCARACVRLSPFAKYQYGCGRWLFLFPYARASPRVDCRIYRKLLLLPRSFFTNERPSFIF